MKIKRRCWALHWYISFAAKGSLCHSTQNQEGLLHVHPWLSQISMSVYTYPSYSCVAELWAPLPRCASVWSPSPGSFTTAGATLLAWALLCRRMISSFPSSAQQNVRESGAEHACCLCRVMGDPQEWEKRFRERSHAIGWVGVGGEDTNTPLTRLQPSPDILQGNALSIY